MSKQAWGNATWFIMHTLAHKLLPEHVDKVPLLLQQFENICRNLPCPDCAKHASQMFDSAKRHLVVDKESLIRFLHELHNVVNIKLGKQCISLEECNNKYSNGRTVIIIRHFFQVFTRIKSHERAMIYGFRRQQCLQGFAIFMDKNLRMFIA